MTITSWSSEILVNTAITDDQRDPEIALLASGDIVVTWVDDAPAVDEIRYRRFDPTGAALGTEGTSDSFYSSTTENSTPTIASFADGGFSITHQSPTPSFPATLTNNF